MTVKKLGTIVYFMLFVFVLLCGCVKTEYDDKKIILIHYYTTESFMPWQTHRFYDFESMTYSAKYIIEEGFEVEFEYERDEYEVLATFTSGKANVFFENIKRHGIYLIEENYHNSDVFDGNSWSLIITFDDGTTFESGGYMKYPKQIKKLDGDFEELSGYKLFGYNPDWESWYF